MALDASTQQITHLNELGIVVDSEAVVQVQRLYSHLNISLPIPQKAVYGAFYDFEPLETNFLCPSADCDWSPYQSRGVCHQCADVKIHVQLDKSCYYNATGTCSMYLSSLLFVDVKLVYDRYDRPIMTVMKPNSFGGLLNIEDVEFSIVNITFLYLASTSDLRREIDGLWQCHYYHRNGWKGLLKTLTCVDKMRNHVRANECTPY